ncbi:MAG: MFS transporter [Christensenellaceae bacterium]|nr:MFS transporter [Christensenellaceae bacterium]
MTEQRAKAVNATALIGCNVCWGSLDLFISTFLIAQLLFITGGNIAMVATYNLVFYVGLFVFYVLLSYFVKRVSSVWCIRAGVFFQVVTISLICIFNDKLTDLYLVFAAVSGIAAGTFWIGYNSFMANTMGGTKMLRFQAYSNIASATAKIILPFTLGAIITYVKFVVAAYVAFGIGLVLVGFTLLMQIDKSSKGRLSFIRHFKLIKTEKLGRPVALNFLMQFIRTLYAGTGLCVIVLLSLYFKDSFSIGYLGSIFSALSIIVLISYRLIKSRKIKNNIFLAASIMAFGLTLGLLFKVDKVTIILFQLASAVMLIVPNIEFGKLQYDVMKELGHPKESTESLVVVELAFFIGRITTMSLIIWAYHANSFWMFRILTAVFMSSAIISYIIFRIWWRLYGNRIPRVPYAKKGTPVQLSPIDN